MELEISKVFKKIFELAIFDQDTNAYYLSKQNYEIIGLSDKEIRRKINIICKKLNINLQYPNKPLPELKDVCLFDEYNQIKSKLETNLPSKEREQLEERRITLRNKITEDNLELIKVIVNRRIYEIHNNIDKEDAYQFGYEMLINYIDKSYLNKDKMKLDINCELILYIENKLLHSNKNISLYQEEQVSKLKQNKSSQTSSDIFEEKDLNERQIRVLTNLENILSSISIEELKDIEQSPYIPKECISQLSDDYEERLIEQLEISECINLIIKTLPKEKQNVINLYYGTNGSSRYNMIQTAKMLGITKAGVSFIITDSLEIIRNSLRIKYLTEYLKDIYETEDISDLELSSKLNFDLEEKLIRNLPTNIINEIMKYLNENQRKFLQLYCQDDTYTISEISKMLNISEPTLYKIKYKIIKTIRILSLNLINETIQTYDEYHYQYIKYLMNLYSHQIKIRKKG